MSQTLPAATAPLPRSRPETQLTAWDIVKKILMPIASLRLTVVLMLLAMVLVFAGTLAQKELGIHIVVSKYFRSWIVLIPLRVFFLWNTDLAKWVAIPFPGGYTIGFALLFNLLAAHIVRFQASWRRIGIWVIHVGIILLMLGELFTGLFAVETRMEISEGKSTNYAEDYHEWELAFVRPKPDSTDDVVVVPARLLQGSKRVNDERVPVQLERVKYFTNSAIEDKQPDGSINLASQGAGLRHFAVEKSPVTGVEQEQSIDIPSAYVRFYDRDGNDLGVWLFSYVLKPQILTINDIRYEVTLRPKRTYKPFSFHLKKFTHDVYPGTEKPKDFRSHIRIVDPETNTDRDVEIYMNTPLRYRGETFYQADFFKPEEPGFPGTKLQVVRNPAWTMPYVSCTLVALGMIIHFMIVLARFIQKETAAPAMRPSLGGAK